MTKYVKFIIFGKVEVFQCILQQLKSLCVSCVKAQPNLQCAMHSMLTSSCSRLCRACRHMAVLIIVDFIFAKFRHIRVMYHCQIYKFYLLFSRVLSLWKKELLSTAKMPRNVKKNCTL